jgi:hypothetical protein
MRVRVLGAFCIAGKRQEPGSECEVADHLVRDLVSRGKAEPVSPVAKPSGPMTTDSAVDLIKGKARKEVKNAG